MALLALALIIGLVLQRAFLLAELNDEVNEQLQQEAEEFRRFVDRMNPDTGAPFGDDVTAIFDTFLDRNIPGEGEVLFTIVDGRPYASTATSVQLLDDAAVVTEWSAVTATTQAELTTAGGRVRYRAVPVAEDSGRGAVFIVAIFLEGERAEIDRALQIGALVYGSIFLIASVAVWFIAGRVLRPVRLLTEAARSIEDTHWSARIPVKGDDDLARLTHTFNDMVNRLETAFVTQRRFIDDAGHELRTPITVIRGHLELMGDDTDEASTGKRIALDELERMTRIVDDLLLLARAEQPDFLDPRSIDVSELMEEVVAKAAVLAPDRTWRITETAHVVMVADRQRLTQALMNLARNAAQHTTSGATIAAGSRYANEEVQFWIRDSGTGIPRAEHERIFERFARGRGGPRRSEGAGLGLAIVKTIAEAHGGRVRVESVPGMGSTFSILLPLSGPGRSA
jgi:two-component system, OmpR family, sensor kinase